MLTFSICISNYNYGNFLKMAIDSCLMQDNKLLKEIIIVDDGSSDNSIEILDDYKNQYPHLIKVLRQKNQGQLSAIKTGIKHASGKIILLLDSDDKYLNAEYLNELEQLYTRKKHIDMLFSTVIVYRNKNELNAFEPSKIEDFDLGKTVFISQKSDCWIGRPTSCISATKDCLQRILDIPDIFDKDWITRADDVIVYGASILGFYKYFYNKQSVAYLIHDSNNFCQKEIKAKDEKIYNDNCKKMQEYYRKQTNLCRKNILAGLLAEYKSKRHFKSKKINEKYTKAFMKINILCCLFSIFELIKTYKHREPVDSVFL